MLEQLGVVLEALGNHIDGAVVALFTHVLERKQRSEPQGQRGLSVFVQQHFFQLGESFGSHFGVMCGGVRWNDLGAKNYAVGNRNSNVKFLSDAAT